ncbi:hypothetical protein O6P43_022823 [Quillaja saponaria]|uniref:Uncharacterized protein n=1 Tax=Quillaja saponaria TaxID=32244 RepID=A0AAD7PIH5_QUISA|nr:hypothetical protein O6P43_022823 [Quillaja saponaria]
MLTLTMPSFPIIFILIFLCGWRFFFCLFFLSPECSSSPVLVQFLVERKWLNSSCFYHRLTPWLYKILVSFICKQENHLLSSLFVCEVPFLFLESSDREVWLGSNFEIPCGVPCFPSCFAH